MRCTRHLINVLINNLTFGIMQRLSVCWMLVFSGKFEISKI